MEYIDKVRIELLKRLRLPETTLSPAPFDYIMPRQHTNRPQNNMDPPKRLQDVEFMMRQVKKGVGNLANRVFFFDDIPTHVLRTEIPSDHYIQITPPFIAGRRDDTDYSPIEIKLSPYNGGRRANKKKRTQRRGRYISKTTRRTQKKKYMSKN